MSRYRFALMLDHVGMRRAEHDIDRIGVRRQDRRQGVHDVFDSLVGRQQSKGEDDRLAVQPETILAAASCGDFGDAVRNQIDLVGRNAMDAFEQVDAGLAHHDQPLGQTGEFLEHRALRWIWFREDRVQRRDDRHAQVAQ
jgi:hypothetical protein